MVNEATAFDFLATPVDAAFLWRQQTAQNSQQAGFAGTIDTLDEQNFAGILLNVQTFEKYPLIADTGQLTDFEQQIGIAHCTT
jgi:hypothetical protein